MEAASIMWMLPMWTSGRSWRLWRHAFLRTLFSRHMLRARPDESNLHELAQLSQALVPSLLGVGDFERQTGTRHDDNAKMGAELISASRTK